MTPRDQDWLVRGPAHSREDFDEIDPFTRPDKRTRLMQIQRQQLNRDGSALLFALFVAWAATTSAVAQDTFAVSLPEGVKAIWESNKAYRESTSTREKICVNGLWRWQPARPSEDLVPSKNWGYFKVPGCWPGVTD